MLASVVLVACVPLTAWAKGKVIPGGNIAPLANVAPPSPFDKLKKCICEIIDNPKPKCKATADAVAAVKGAKGVIPYIGEMYIANTTHPVFPFYSGNRKKDGKDVPAVTHTECGYIILNADAPSWANDYFKKATLAEEADHRGLALSLAEAKPNGGKPGSGGDQAKIDDALKAAYTAYIDVRAKPVVWNGDKGDPATGLEGQMPDFPPPYADPNNPTQAEKDAVKDYFAWIWAVLKVAQYTKQNNTALEDALKEIAPNLVLPSEIQDQMTEKQKSDFVKLKKCLDDSKDALNEMMDALKAHDTKTGQTQADKVCKK